MAKVDLNKYIKKSHFKMVEKFNEELEAFRKETGDELAELYEDAYTSFKLGTIRIENGMLRYRYEDGEDFDKVVLRDPDTGEYYEDEGMDSIPEIIKFYRRCLKRARRYWVMDVERLDAIQNGEQEDEDDDEE